MSSNIPSLKRLTSGQLLNQHVVYIDMPLPAISVGRVEEVKSYSLDEMVARGVIADIVLVQADHHEDLADLFHNMYIYRNVPEECPEQGVFYQWPDDRLPPLTFEWPKLPGRYVKIALRPSTGVIVIVSSSSEGDAGVME
ncbi:MAG TPA: hypothetical protein VFA10_27160 [Ktedonobacteraceae bacterium]|nr:hypothetical protein [Ktedonobacteraceae bacterium]